MSNDLGQGDSEHPSSRGSGKLLHEMSGGIKVLGWGGEAFGFGRMGDRAAGRGIRCVGEGAARRVATANLSRPSSQVPEVWGWGFGGPGAGDQKAGD